MKVNPVYVGGSVVFGVVLFALGRFTAPVAELNVSTLETTAKDHGEMLANSANSVAPAQDFADSRLSDFELNQEANSESTSLFGSARFLALCQRDPVAALEEALKDKSRIGRIAKLAMALEELNEDNLPDMLALFNEMPGGWESMQEYNMLMYAWGQFDAPAAVAYAQENLNGRSGRFAASTAVVAWAESDPQAVTAWLSSQEGGLEGPLSYGLVRGWASSDPYAASDFVMSMEGQDGRMMDRYLDMIASELYSRSATEAANWALSLPDDKRSQAFEQVARQWSDKDPEAAADWLMEYANTDFAGDAIVRVIEDLAEKDISKAIPYLDELPAGETRDKALAEVINEWSRDDLVAAGEYLNTLPSSPANDAAIDQYARRVARDEPSSAMPWATAISDPEARAATTLEIGQYWYSRDPDAAAVWLEQNIDMFTDDELVLIQNPPKNIRLNNGGRRFRP